jgi:hypothetical protein
MQFRTLGFPVMIAGAWLLGACSPDGGDGGDGDDGPTCPPGTCPVQTTGVNLIEPRITYLQDLMSADPQVGTIRRACNSSSCHGRVVNPATSAAGLYLGPNISNSTNVPIDDALCQNVRTNLLASSKTFPQMKIVVPREPQNSFLMLKIDGCHNSLGVPRCTTGQVSTLEMPCCTPQPNAKSDGACGDLMPQTAGNGLCRDERDNIRRWIAQGAECGEPK